MEDRKSGVVGLETGFNISEMGVKSEQFLSEMADKCGMSVRDLYEEWHENKYSHEQVDPVRWLNDDYYMGATGSRTFPGVKDDFYRITMANPRPMRIILKGCVELSAIIQTSDGCFKTLKDLVGKSNLTVSGLTGIRAAKDARRSGVKKLLCLTLSNGMSLKLTPDHKIIGKNGWVEAKNLSCGDLVATPRIIKTKPSSDISKEEAKFIGYFIGDGSSSTTRARFCDQSILCCAEVLRLGRELGFEGKLYRKGAAHEVNFSRVKTSLFLDFLQSHNLLGNGSKNRVVPDKIASSSLESVAGFLNGLFSCEGTVTWKSNTAPSVKLGLANHRLINEIQLLLLRFGIRSHISKKQSFHKKQKKVYSWWVLGIYGKETLNLFFSKIDILTGKATACRRCLDRINNITANTNIDVIPMTYREMGEYCKINNINIREDKWLTCPSCGKVYASFSDLLKYIHLPEYKELKEKYVDSNIRWERVKSIIETKNGETGDIGVEDEHCFIANGIPVHNSIGWGKSWLAAILIDWLIYELSCLKNPQIFYGLAPMSQISFMNLSVSATHAQRVVYRYIRDMIDESPYFQKEFPRATRLQTIIDFPQKFISVIPGSSSELAPLGENLFGGVIDEANFFQVVRGSKKIVNPAEREWDQAKKLHDSIWRRMKSRYQSLGRVPGYLVLCSSAKHPADFLERLSANADGVETVVFDHSEWETKPTTRYSGKHFFLFTGDGKTVPRKIEESEVKAYEKRGEVCAIPVEYEKDFNADMEGAIRDILGKNLRSINRFMPDDNRIVGMFEKNLPMPFVDSWPEGIPYDRLEMAINVDLLGREAEDKETHRRYARAKVHPGALRCAHIDLSSTGDSTGIAIVHVGNIKEIKRMRSKKRNYAPIYNAFGMEETEDIDEPVTEAVPVIYVDFVARINPPMIGEIEFEKIREILYQFRDLLGIRFSRITYDQYGSRESQQVLRKRFGEEVVGYASADKTPDPYLVLKECINESRIKCYPYKPLLDELRALQRNLQTGKIDHPSGGAKDCSDAVACATFAAIKQFDLGVADLPQFGEFIDDETPEEKLDRESRAWLLGTPVKKKPQNLIETEEMQIMKALMSGNLEDEDEDDDIY